MNRREKKEIRRKVKKIPETAQMSFMDPGPAPEKAACLHAGEDDFINPSPEAIFFGEQRLRDYLIDCDLGWVIRLRELLEESDLSEFKGGYQATGRKAIHPVIMLGLIVYGIIEGKWSLRGLESLASRDLGAMWLCGGLRPDHSTVGNFINRFGNILTVKYFIELTRMLLKKLRIPSGDVAGDGTVIEAAASRYKLIKAEAAREAARLAQAETELRPRDDEARVASEKAEKVARIAKERAQTIKESGRDPDKKMRLSPVEPEAVNQPMKNKTTRPSYKPSVLANEFRMIVGQRVEASDESAAVNPMLKQYDAIFGTQPECAMFDAGYHNQTVLGLALELDLNVLCPSGKADKGEWDKRSKKGKYGKKMFRYDEERDVYICPAGRKLGRIGASRKAKHKCVIYRCNDCGLCQHRSRCTKDKLGRTVSRYEVDAAKEAMSLVFENERARKAYSRRKSMVEPVFSRLRADQNLNRFHRYGPKNVRVEFSLHCIAYNLKRAIRLEAGALLCVIFVKIQGKIRLFAVAFFVFNASGKYP